MKIAVPFEDGQVFQHFGRSAQFKFYEAENGQLLRTEVIPTNGQGHGALAGFLVQHGADVVLNLGLESLHVRMQRHCANGMAVAKFLEAHPKVAYVNYCGLESSPYHALAEKYLPNGSCGVVSFGLAGGREAASTFMKELKLAAIETHVADARTCCLNPASSTHRQMNDEQLRAAGVPAELVRMSCGLESSEDLIADIAQALDQI